MRRRQSRLAVIGSRRPPDRFKVFRKKFEEHFLYLYFNYLPARSCLFQHARFSDKGENVITTLDRICQQVEYPKTTCVDNDSEFISREMDLWACRQNVTLDFSWPGKPTDNAYLEAFNRKFRADCLTAHWIMEFDDTVEKLEAWRSNFNEEWPHSAIGNKVPAALMILPDACDPSA